LVNPKIGFISNIKLIYYNLYATFGLKQKVTLFIIWGAFLAKVSLCGGFHSLPAFWGVIHSNISFRDLLDLSGLSLAIKVLNDFSYAILDAIKPLFKFT